LKHKYIYIDESGDLGLSSRSSKVLVVSALIIDNPKKLDRIIKNARRHKFKNELRKASEIKANSSSHELKVYLIEKLNSLEDIQSYHCILWKDNLYSEYLKHDKNKLYNYVAGALAKMIVIDSSMVEARIDKSKSKKVLRDDFNHYFEDNLRQKSSIQKVDIFYSYSQSFSGIQLVDLLAWAAFRKFNYGDESYFDLIKFSQSVSELWKSKN